ncbi:MAG: bifunctional UDP-N-acetylglucosamine pyrophosphorylase/glucosamine-1-phosphate N-acetyltransferase [Bradymonadia bacterium]|jgi:bifunctional UDP-N-acetylglucosamine pyrophosphorylase/glucosamine-1-phosphate N-acetyltransferase
MSKPFKALILAAGMGTRLKSTVPKVLHKVLGREMLTYPVDVALAAGAVEVAVVVGHGRDQVERTLQARYHANIDDGPGDAYVTTHVQHEMLGTADAVKSALPAFTDFDGAVMILSGDVPNIPAECIAQLVALHTASDSPVSMVTAHDPTPNAYGRIERDEQGGVNAITEFKDASDSVRALTEVNLGTYLVDADFLRTGLKNITSDNAQGEFYLTDLVAMAYAAGTPTRTLIWEDIDALHGVNDRTHLARATEYARIRRNDAIMKSGVTMIDPASVTIEADVIVGNDVTIEPGCYLLGTTNVGAGSTIKLGCRLENATIPGGETVPAHTSLLG